MLCDKIENDQQNDQHLCDKIRKPALLVKLTFILRSQEFNIQNLDRICRISRFLI